MGKETLTIRFCLSSSYRFYLVIRNRKAEGHNIIGLIVSSITCSAHAQLLAVNETEVFGRKLLLRLYGYPAYHKTTLKLAHLNPKMKKTMIRFG